MILLAFFLGALGLADLTRVRGGARARRDDRRSGASTVLGAALGIAAFVLASVSSGLPLWWSPIAGAAIIGWLFATREGGEGNPDADRRAGYWALGALAAVIAAAFVWGPWLPRPHGPLPAWYDGLSYAVLDGISFTTFALVLGGALFLVETSNVIVRLALRGERAAPIDTVADVAAGAMAGAVAAQATSPSEAVAATPTAAASSPARHRWWSRTPVAPAPAPAPEPTPAQNVALEPSPVPFVELKGGRFIGPLERLFLLALVLAGQFTAIAALVAAKGIIRFPEISKDTTGGSKAEYFLVGSFASWALVLLVALLAALGAPRG
ncbi:hypothetical protein GCM10027413_12670 [Conyzicola nivalis]|uniref:Uncharacterized protein n=1 Tax=Conyzicola nivalis TaxID=1477021 RepID=A0A916SJG7_9MICO|nr:hypothetical protein [Conyzicola nivalis]GGB00673.1 hypothetical protein GCM10010979_13960 [Conyzicola nivalis]